MNDPARETGIAIRPMTKADLPAIALINERAFAAHGRTASFDEIRAAGVDTVSLVAEVGGRLAGQILFSPVRLETAAGPVAGMGLGQLAVDPDYQNQGVGTRLGHAGIEILRERACPFVIVIGHAAYYPRFGFEPGSLHGIRCQWEGIPDPTFMVMFPTGNPSGDAKNAFRGMAFFEGL